MSYLSDKTGRPKEQGGHERINISVEKFVADGLEKVGNKSQFLEKVARPVLEKFDPGDASVFLWRTDIFISQGIINATEKGDFKQVQALGWLAGQLDDARKLCGIPHDKSLIPRDSQAEKPSEVELIRENLIKDEIKLSWNRLELLADEKGLKPHPVALYKENMKKAEEASLEFMLLDREEIDCQVRKNIIRYWISKLE